MLSACYRTGTGDRCFKLRLQTALKSKGHLFAFLE